MNRNELDRLLTAPLASIEDGGFSTRVMARISLAHERLSMLETALLAVAAGFVLAFLSAAGFSESIARIGFSVATSLPLAIAAFALALTHACARVFAE